MKIGTVQVFRLWLEAKSDRGGFCEAIHDVGLQ